MDILACSGVSFAIAYCKNNQLSCNLVSALVAYVSRRSDASVDLVSKSKKLLSERDFYSTLPHLAIMAINDRTLRNAPVHLRLEQLIRRHIASAPYDPITCDDVYILFFVTSGAS